MWRVLNEDQIKQFRQWTRENYKPGEEINGVHHPIVQLECVLMNFEYLMSFNRLNELESEDIKLEIKKILNNWRN